MRMLISHLLLICGVVLAGECQTVRQVLHLESPNYPELARQARIDGIVKAHVHIDARGAIVGVDFDSGPPLLRKEVEQNVGKWRFEPGTESISDISYEFRLMKPDVNYRPPVEVSFDLPSNVLIVSHAPVPILDGVPIPKKK